MSKKSTKNYLFKIGVFKAYKATSCNECSYEINGTCIITLLKVSKTRYRECRRKKMYYCYINKVKHKYRKDDKNIARCSICHRVDNCLRNFPKDCCYDNCYRRKKSPRHMNGL